MIYTITVNPTIDFVARAETLIPGEINYYSDEKAYPSGKGVNVSVLLARLGVRTTALGICGGFTGTEFLRLLGEEGVEADFVSLQSGTTRINFKLNAGTETELNSRGPVPDRESLENLLKKTDRIQSGDTAVLAGSLPPGTPPDYYEQILKRLSGRDIRLVLDTADLLPLLQYKPFLVKPNQLELGTMFGRQVASAEEAAELGCEMRAMGAQNVLISMGAQGAVLLTEAGVTSAPALAGKVISPCCAGDSMVAGFLYGMGEGLLEGLKWGSAAGAATAFSAGIASREKILESYKKIHGLFA